MIRNMNMFFEYIKRVLKILTREIFDFVLRKNRFDETNNILIAIALSR